MAHYTIFIAGMQYGESYTHYKDADLALQAFRRKIPGLAQSARLLRFRVSN